MKRQLYIGAKCVPSFYIGSGGSSEWAPGVPYEPLTIVTYDGKWFISKIPVPSTAAAPEVGQYWVQVPGYLTDLDADFIEWAQQHIGDLEDDVEDLQGDVTDLRDDLEAFADCEIVMHKTFTTNTKNANDWITTGLPILDPTAVYYAYLVSVENVNVSTRPYLVINNTYTTGSNAQTSITEIGKFTKIIFDNSRTYQNTILNVWKADSSLSDPVQAKWTLLIVKGTPQSIDLNIIDNAITISGGYLLDWSNYLYYYGSGAIALASNRIGIIVPVVASSDLHVSIRSGYKYAVFRFSSTTPSPATEISSTGWITSEHTIYKDEIFLINIAKSNDEAITAAECQNLTMVSFISNSTITNDYVISAELIKRSVSTKNIGTVKYAQSFCTYDGKYYSTDGSHIAEQDSAFNLLRDVAITAGHGNSLQLGTGNLAYASGWDDNKIYIIDLVDLEVTGTITLPTTGYTTGVVDDLNEIVYIFQRDSYPDTVTNYNFIVYDYDNQQILLQKTINNAFGAMQAADFYNGKIIVTWGTGTTTLPSGLAVYNTNGDMLAEYSLSIFATSEPEGVCFSRSDKRLLLGIWTTVYEIT